MDEIRLAVMDAFFSLPRGGAEIGGVLYGAWADGRLEIREHRPLECEHKLGPSFVLSPNDHARLAALVENYLDDPLLHGLRPAGWYHSHTRSEIFLSPQDLEIHNRYFPEKWQVALVLRPSSLNPLRAGFFFRDPHGNLAAEKSYSEFVVKPLNGVAQRVPARNGSAAVSPEPEPRPAEEPLPLPSFLMEAAKPRSHKWLWVMAALLVLGGGGAAGWATRAEWLPMLPITKAGKAEPIALAATDAAGNLQIRWDPAAGAVRQARAGSLTIDDGGTRRVVPLDTSQIRRGSYLYARQSGEVNLWLAVDTGSGAQQEAATMFRAQPVAPTSGNAQQQMEEAAREIEKLKSDLRREEDRNRTLERALQQMRIIIQRDQEQRRMQNQNRDNPSQ